MPAASPAAPRWAPAATASIRPGSATASDGAGCTANFVFYDAKYVYIGQAAHCTSDDASTETNGCTASIRPGVRTVMVEGATRPAKMVYSSWSTMQARKEKDPNACLYNDFALVRLDPADARRVNPSVPYWGGPVALSAGATFGERVYSFGNSDLWMGIGTLKPHQGVTLGTSAGWSHKVYTAPPGIPGDSGSAYLDARGRALGLLSTIEATPFAASNNVTDLARALAYMRATTSFKGVKLALGTEPFRP